MSQKDNCINKLDSNSTSNILPYASVQYWDLRYLKNSYSYDWLEDYLSLKDDLFNIFTNVSNTMKIDIKYINILNIGCGTSPLFDNINKDFGIDCVTNIDYSMTDINIMQSRYNNHINMKWIKDDIFNIKLSPNSFDVIFDKATSDTFYCQIDSTNKLLLYYKIVFLALKVGGSFILISRKDNRKHLIDICGFNFDVVVTQKDHQINDTQSTSNYIYICTKTNDSFDEVAFNKLYNNGVVDNLNDDNDDSNLIDNSLN